MNSAEAEPRELATERPRDRPPKTCLADSRWTYQTQNRTLWFFFQFAHRERLQDAIFNFLEAIMIFVQDSLSFVQI